MLLEPSAINWATADDSTVVYAARDGVPEAKAELLRREARAIVADRTKTR